MRGLGEEKREERKKMKEKKEAKERKRKKIKGKENHMISTLTFSNDYELVHEVENSLELM